MLEATNNGNGKEKHYIMENSVYAPSQVLERIMQAGEKRILLPVVRCILLGMLAGGFIAFGAASSSVAAHQITNTGLSRLTMGAVFPVGLIMIVLVGGELFTGDCLMVTGIWDRRYGIGQMIRVLTLVWFSNLVGSILIAILVSYSGIFSYSESGMGAFMIKIAYGKCGMQPAQAFCSGILCNILVCCAVLMATAAKDAVGKIVAIFFPIMAFVVGGWEHCVANMFYLPAGIFAAHNSDYVTKVTELYGLHAQQIQEQVNLAGFLKNMVPVTLGNIVGAMVFVALPLFISHREKKISKR